MLARRSLSDACPPPAREARAGGMARGAAPYVLAAALHAACCAWPCTALAQRTAPGGASSASAVDQPANSQSSPAQREPSDEQRLLGGPSSAGGSPYSANPYRSDGASPDDEEDALTNEKHMHVFAPSSYGASGTSAAGGRDASRGGRPITSGSRIGPNGISRAGNALNKSTGSSGHRTAAGYDYGASQTSPAAHMYGNPYSNPYESPGESAAQLYKSPW